MTRIKRKEIVLKQKKNETKNKKTLLKNRFERLFLKSKNLDFNVLSLNHLNHTKIDLNCLFQYQRTKRARKSKITFQKN